MTTAVARADAPIVPVQTRSERLRSFDPADFGDPTGREVNWKLTPLDRVRPLLVATAGDGSVSWETSAPNSVTVSALRASEHPRGSALVPEDLAAAIVATHVEEALTLTIPRETEIVEPILVTARATASEGRDLAHIVIHALEGSHATVVLRHEGAGRLCENVEIVLEAGATLTVVSWQQWEPSAVHLSTQHATVADGATLRHVVASFGGGVVRVNPSVDLAGERSSAEMLGVCVADSGQHLESQVYVHHRGAHTSADVLFKGALKGAGARTVWVGDVLIGPDAVGTDSYEANRNLVLTEGARADSIPNLEIETGDIQGAGHASATGRFDDEQLFYLQSRGLPEAEAKQLVVLGFLVEIAQRLPNEELQRELIDAILRELEEVVE